MWVPCNLFLWHIKPTSNDDCHRYVCVLATSLLPLIINTNMCRSLLPIFSISFFTVFHQFSISKKNVHKMKCALKVEQLLYLFYHNRFFLSLEKRTNLPALIRNTVELVLLVLTQGTQNSRPHKSWFYMARWLVMWPLPYFVSKRGQERMCGYS